MTFPCSARLATTGRLFVEVNMPLKGVSRVRSNYARVVKNIEQRNAKVVTAILSIGAGFAKMYTPVDTSALINSQRKSISKSGYGAVVGRVWYSQDYALWLEISSSWKPRKKKGAKPHFLKSGFEDATPQSEIKEIIRNGYKL